MPLTNKGKIMKAMKKNMAQKEVKQYFMLLEIKVKSKVLKKQLWEEQCLKSLFLKHLAKAKKTKKLIVKKEALKF